MEEGKEKELSDFTDVLVRFGPDSAEVEIWRQRYVNDSDMLTRMDATIRSHREFLLAAETNNTALWPPIIACILLFLTGLIIHYLRIR